MLSRGWRCSWNSADRRSSNFIWVINNLISYLSTSYIRDLTVHFIQWMIMIKKNADSGLPNIHCNVRADIATWHTKLRQILQFWKGLNDKKHFYIKFKFKTVIWLTKQNRFYKCTKVTHNNTNSHTHTQDIRVWIYSRNAVYRLQWFGHTCYDRAYIYICAYNVLIFNIFNTVINAVKTTFIFQDRISNIYISIRNSIIAHHIQCRICELRLALLLVIFQFKWLTEGSHHF